MELSIGEIAALLDLPVKTVRFYADDGLLPHVGRTAAGHRRFDERHVARLELIRTLRQLGTDLASIRRLLDRELELDDVLRAQAELVRREQVRLERRRAVIEAALASGSEDVVLKLPLLDRLDAHERTALLERFWDEVLVDAPDASTAAAFRAAGLPELPEEPDATTLLAWLELVELATDPSFVASVRHMGAWGQHLTGDRDPAAVTAAVMDALDAVVAAGDDADAVEAAVDGYVAVHADLLARRDTPAFRRWLGEELDRLSDPRAARFWELVNRVRDADAPAGARRRAEAMDEVLARLRS